MEKLINANAIKFSGILKDGLTEKEIETLKLLMENCYREGESAALKRISDVRASE